MRFSDSHGPPNTFNGDDGSLPRAGLTFDAAGNLYGITGYGGGSGGCYFTGDCGTVFKLTQSARTPFHRLGDPPPTPWKY